jgi:glutamine synthetase
MMDVAERTARRHNFRVLFHEKPFSGINGSGKHNNWSLTTDTGVNLLSPGKTPRTNTMFLTFLVNTIMAVYKHADLLRASIVSAGNVHRLGANEAPPAIISVFLGTQITEMLDEIESKVTTKKMTPDEKTELKLNIGKIPEILLDNTDRNRTSPFAFTGNRFEFRAVGSSANCGSPMLALNTAVADQLVQFKAEVDAIIEKGVKKDEAIFQVLRKYIIECKAIRFDGNNYSDEWLVEAKKRGLSNIKDVPEALEHYITKKTVDLFKRQDVLTERELHARTEVKLEMFTKKLQIESRVLGDLVMNHIVPIAITYQTSLLENVKGMKEIFSGEEFQEMAAGRIELIKEVSGHISYIKLKVKEMVNARKVANKIEDSRKKADAYSSEIFPYLEDIRYHIDKLELIIDNEMWPLPKYRELLFTR